MIDADIMWCQNLWNNLNDGGVWAVPQSGLVFQKDKAKMQLALVTRMPHDPEMPVTAEDLRNQQDSDFRAIATRFALIGVDVIKRVRP